ncbi:Fanconi anemia core complex-associated protein 24 isoform X2 [Monodelphis domestica]|uniref:Fanconi anemia core complex-associated protein 24 isoform X2 n=1 Tax=Monodelphis domestica TaxID=13616 RepID=UPI0024E23B15|nr:Fanconi anemia core complex-associated protein 24 isoform X2 [Monodelphis domestica]XP_007474831.2 Fanconi anemia core complex-associated protein 24 isoform X2 [Monodelphis domestica]XP_007474832.2 Fanconi anemia core complex-associated protein 24 isoform X2 [Monodelphis domestica]XP_056668184.1 Fanconi anemia core complex-associated protein 24 isoform X2 [Monodelphis domestica]XP_056668185.1 Fanconi anemia core complex-associated protein 24 isoform X2 [Monodelphis domestica]
MEKEATFSSTGLLQVPFGHVIGSEKWRGSQLAQEMQGKIKLIFEEGLAPVDFHLSNRFCILYITEADLVAGNNYKKRIVQLRNASNLKGIIIVEKTQMSEQYFTTVQKFVVLELGMTLLPVSNQMEASQLIIQLVHEQTKERNRNPFLKKKSCQLCESSVLQTVQQIPGVGKVMALLLLQEFPSIQKLSNASIQELERVVGHTLAEKMHTFFTQIR